VSIHRVCGEFLFVQSAVEERVGRHEGDDLVAFAVHHVERGVRSLRAIFVLERDILDILACPAANSKSAIIWLRARSAASRSTGAVKVQFILTDCAGQDHWATRIYLGSRYRP
jgi:hypothetical protein